MIGVVCGLVSAGGAFMTVPFMLFCGVSMTTAIGTGAALGVPVAVVGTLGYVFSGHQVAELPPLALGFVYGPALLGIVAGSVLTAPLGARAAHRMPVATLRRIFAGLLYVLAAKMALDLSPGRSGRSRTFVRTQGRADPEGSSLLVDT